MITTLLDADLEESDRENEAHYQDMRFMMAHPKIWQVKTLFLVDLPSFFHRNITCKLFDHDIQMDGWFGPDSGGEDWWCKRGCGFGGRHIYY